MGKETKISLGIVTKISLGIVTKISLGIVIVALVIISIFIVIHLVRKPNTLPNKDLQWGYSPRKWDQSKINTVENQILRILDDPYLKIKKETAIIISKCTANKLAAEFHEYESVSQEIKNVLNRVEISPEYWEVYKTCLKEYAELIGKDLDCPGHFNPSAYRGKKDIGAIIHDYALYCTQTPLFSDLSN